MRGLNLELEKAQQDGSEWKFGGLSQPGLVSIPEAEREQYLPQGETQFTPQFDALDCATRSPINHLEALFTYHYLHNMQEENKAWLRDKGYVKNSRVTFSDRFVAINSGSTKQGNSLKAPLEAIRKQGLIPKYLLPKDGCTSWEQYMSGITPEMRDLATEFAKRFTINYEQVFQDHFADVLKDDMIGVAGFAWLKPVNGIYERVDPSQGFNHAFLLYKLPKFQAFDNYYDFSDQGVQLEGDFTKNLAPDYNFFNYGYRVYLSAEYTSKDFERGNIIAQVWQALWTFGLSAFFPAWLTDFEKPATITIPATLPPPPEPKKFLWATPLQAKHSLRVISDEEGLNLEQKNTFCATIGAESGWKNTALNHNKNAKGEITSTDYGICQINSYWNIGPGKPFPSVTFVLSNPEAVVRWAARQWKAGNRHLWWAYRNQSYKRYL